MLGELQYLKEVFDGTPGYADFLDSPCIPVKERLDAVQAAFGDDLTEYAMSFVSLLCEQNCADILPDCAQEYERLYNQKNRVTLARVTSAVALDARQKQSLSAMLEEISGTRVKTVYEVDASLLGGLTVDLDGLLMDGSLRGRLRNIREVMDE